MKGRQKGGWKAVERCFLGFGTAIKMSSWLPLATTAMGAERPGHLAWGVVTAGPPSRFALAGNYTGPGAGFALGDGFNANSLVGAYGNSISLQPLSAGGSPGINLSAGTGALSLQPTAPPRQRGSCGTMVR